jgi:hypothetical protein
MTMSGLVNQESYTGLSTKELLQLKKTLGKIRNNLSAHLSVGAAEAGAGKTISVDAE